MEFHWGKTTGREPAVLENQARKSWVKILGSNWSLVPVLMLESAGVSALSWFFLIPDLRVSSLTGMFISPDPQTLRTKRRNMTVVYHRDPSLCGIYSHRHRKPGKAAGQRLSKAGPFSAISCCSAASVPWDMVPESIWLIGKPAALLGVM